MRANLLADHADVDPRQTVLRPEAFFCERQITEPDPCKTQQSASAGVGATAAQEAANDPAGAFHGVEPAALRLAGGSLTGPDGRSEPLARALRRVAAGALEIHDENLPEGLPPSALESLYKGEAQMLRGADRKDVAAFTFGAHFVEVRVHRLTREIRTPRVVSAFSAGTIVNPLTAHSQFTGGTIWGLSAALMESTEIDRRVARYERQPGQLSHPGERRRTRHRGDHRSGDGRSS